VPFGSHEGAKVKKEKKGRWVAKDASTASQRFLKGANALISFFDFNPLREINWRDHSAQSLAESRCRWQRPPP
jgi:hypothetical protein